MTAHLIMAQLEDEDGTAYPHPVMVDGDRHRFIEDGEACRVCDSCLSDPQHEGFNNPEYRQPPPEQVVYRVTFGSKYAYERHPHRPDANIHPDNWVEYVSPMGPRHVRLDLVARLGNKWSSMYADDWDPQYFPGGCVLRFAWDDYTGRYEEVDPGDV